ncbi:hypothetical protein GGX14DRAFT_566910 [Mycena pura]|uniref:Uncharacterized protein n=1 Tax=Mycena pura TaxID=153505 RepID=A0AAD6VBC7_9AGAR|nr:hypothetical protein GGX14DRAFT_566910 [Mycena pura]
MPRAVECPPAHNPENVPHFILLPCDACHLNHRHLFLLARRRAPPSCLSPVSPHSARANGRDARGTHFALPVAQRFPIATSEDLAEAGGIWLKQACSAWDVRRKGDLAVRAMATEHTQVYHFMGTDDATATLEFGQWPPTSVDWWLRRCVHGDATRPWASRRGAQFTIDTMEGRWHHMRGCHGSAPGPGQLAGHAVHDRHRGGWWHRARRRHVCAV